MARRYDEALRPLGLTNGQFSLMMLLNRAQAPSIGQVSTLLAMDRTTLTANLKPLERRGLIQMTIDDADKRSRRLALTPAGRDLLVAAFRSGNELTRRSSACSVHPIPTACGPICARCLDPWSCSRCPSRVTIEPPFFRGEQAI